MKGNPLSRRSTQWIAGKISLIYALVALAWIISSSRIVALLFTSPSMIATVETLKGGFFVAATSTLLYFLILGNLNKLASLKETNRAQYEEFQVWMEAGRVAVWSWYPDSKHLVRSRNFGEVVRDSAHEDACDFITKDLTSESREEADQQIVACLSENQPIEGVFKYLDLNGQPRWLEVRGHCDAAAKTPRIIGTVLDVTDRQVISEQLEALTRELELRVVERTSQLTAANEELEAFTHTVAHDLRTPLRGIDSSAVMLMEDYADALPEGANANLTRIRTGVKRMAGLIDDLLRLARLGQGQFSRERVDISQMVESIVDELRRTFPDRNISLNVQPNLVAHGDRVLLNAAFENVLDNALKFSQSQPVTNIEVGSTLTDGKPAFFIRDNGIGFDPKDAERAFEPFRRLHADSSIPGTGIGLATVDRILRRHGGSAKAESHPGEGTTIYFVL